MALANEKMYALAKEQGERDFIEAWNMSASPPLVAIQADGEIDYKLHADVMAVSFDSAHSSNVVKLIDVKDVEEKNFSTGNYVLRNDFVEYHTETVHDGRYFTAFRLIEDGKRAMKFLLVRTQEMLEKCKLEDKKSFKLVSLAEVKSKCQFEVIEPEKIE